MEVPAKDFDYLAIILFKLVSCCHILMELKFFSFLAPVIGKEKE